MSHHVVAIVPSTDLTASTAFYAQLGFTSRPTGANIAFWRMAAAGTFTCATRPAGQPTSRTIPSAFISMSTTSTRSPTGCASSSSCPTRPTPPPGAPTNSRSAIPAASSSALAASWADAAGHRSTRLERHPSAGRTFVEAPPLATRDPSPRTWSGVHSSTQSGASAPAARWMPEHVRHDGEAFSVAPASTRFDPPTPKRHPSAGWGLSRLPMRPNRTIPACG